MKTKKTACYCGSQNHFENCCSPFLSGTLKPENPEQLMRSRYSAFCLENIDYLISTHHPSRRQPNLRDVLAETAHRTQWLGLKVLKEKYKISQKTGYVEFVAFYKDDKIGQLHEKSKFIHEKGQWFYVDGVLLEPVNFGRNESCWCGSKKKYKKCHGR